MSKFEVVLLVSMLLFSAISFIIGFFQFREKGFLFNNAYIYASEEERSSMNKAPYYRQSAITFCICGVMLIPIGLAVIPGWNWLFRVGNVFAVLLCIYSIVSTVRIKRKLR